MSQPLRKLYKKSQVAQAKTKLPSESLNKNTSVFRSVTGLVGLLLRIAIFLLEEPIVELPADCLMSGINWLCQCVR